MKVVVVGFVCFVGGFLFATYLAFNHNTPKERIGRDDRIDNGD